MNDMSEHLLEQYYIYMEQNCTCAISEDECLCMTFQQFSDHVLRERERFWEGVYEYEEPSYGALICQR